MHQVDFDSLQACFVRLWKNSIFLHSTCRRLAEKYPEGIHAALDDDQAETIRGLAEKIAAIDKQLGPLMLANEPARCPPHYCDNQGYCHYCGIVMEPDWNEQAESGRKT